MRGAEDKKSESNEWSVLMDSVRRHRDIRARYFKPTCLFAVSQLIDEGIISESRLEPGPVIDRFSVLVQPVYPEAASRGWMPFWHLTRDKAWNCYHETILVTRKSFPPIGKPRSRRKLTDVIEYASVPETMSRYWRNRVSRKLLRKEIVEMLLKDDDISAQAMGEYLNVCYLEDQESIIFPQYRDIPNITGNFIEDYSIYRVHCRIERDQKLVKRVKETLGFICKLCGIDFEKVYGDIGKGYIEAHHVNPVSTLKGKQRNIVPEKDFIVLCANCHRMIHRAKLANNMPRDLANYLLKYNKPRVLYK